MESTTDLIRSMRDRRVLVLGDVMLDEFIYGQVDRVSPESGVPVFLERRRSCMPGGAANVAVNIAALGGRCTVIGLCGSDAAASSLRERLACWSNIQSNIVEDSAWQTTVKARFINHKTGAHLLRADQERQGSPTSGVCEDLERLTLRAIQQADVVILSDYRKGVLTLDLVRKTIDAAATLGIPVIVDPKNRDFQLYHGATVLLPNLDELSLAFGKTVPQDSTKVKKLQPP